MKIDSSTVGMESTRSYQASTTAIRRFVLADYQGGSNALNAAIGGDTGSAEETQEEGNSTGTTGERASTTLQDWQNRFNASVSSVSIRSSASQTFSEIRDQTIRYIFDMLFGRRNSSISKWFEKNNQTVSNQSQNQNLTQGTQIPMLSTNIKVLNFSQENISMEKESTSFSTVGTVKTADGREINFNVNVGMSREFQAYYREDLALESFTMCDPLVINLDTDVAALTDQTFYFDIDADGEEDKISQLNAGSGYLALDKNGDGTINDGSELFGTASGNGFADLAKYDEDGNGWIDENDAVWDKLQIWTKDENGRDMLYKLSEKGVGAICLQNVSTDFTQKGQGGQTLGAVRSSGVFLYENGNVGTVQHVDIAKYSKEA